MPSLPTGTVTFLFTDIEGSTTLLQRLGDRRYAEFLAEHQRLLREAFAEGDGQEIDTQGDAFLVAFPRARDAVGAAVAAQQMLAAHTWPDGASLRVRMGLHTGEPIGGKSGYVGIDVHRAARICAAGHGGQILLSDSTHALVARDLPEELELRDLGEHRLKDLAYPHRLFQVVHPDLPTDFPPVRSLDAHRHNLPIQLTSFIGRVREIAEVKRLVGAARLVTLTGSGGAGKTRLALQVAADVTEGYPDGVWFAEFAPIADPALIPKTVASTLSVPEQPGRDITEALIDALRRKTLLLVFDNCEHLLAACRDLAAALLRKCSHVRILATSREGLGVPGEALWRVPSLALPEDISDLPPAKDLILYDAVRLFVDRAATTTPDFTVTTENAPAVARVCRQLDGIPLAIELAAARLKVLAVEQIAARLADRFRLLTGGSPTLLPRQQTLRATLDWSYDLLSDQERAVLRRLSVFAGGWTLEAAEAVCAGAGVGVSEILDLLTSLVDKSLGIAEARSEEARYRLLETVRQYGWERLVSSNEAADVRRRHRDWYLELAERAEPELLGPGQVVWLERLEAEHDNLRAALETTRAEEGGAEAWLRLAGALPYFWWFRGYEREGRTWLEAALSAGGTISGVARAKALYGAGVLAWHEDDLEPAGTRLQESLALFRESGDESGFTDALHQLGHVAEGQRDYGRAAALMEESLARSREAGDKWGVGWVLNCLGGLTLRQGDINRARTLLEESLPICREVGNMFNLAYVHRDLGEIAETQGDYQEARVLFEEALRVTRRVGNTRHVPELKYRLASLSLREGNSERARSLYRESLLLHRDRGDKSWLVRDLEGFGRAVSAQRQYEKAARLFGAADMARQTLDFQRRASERVDHERYMASTRAALGEKSFDAAWAKGQAMTLEQAIEYALTDRPDATNP